MTPHCPSLSRIVLFALLSLLLAACAGTPTAVTGASTPAARSVLLVSLDGFRAGDIDPVRTPVLARLAADGVRADWMTPSYPTLTFPNHYTMVTGLRPDRHGIVHNTMRDASLGRFRLADREAVGDGRWWQGEPIWVTAERAGLPTATLFWPGSEAAVGGVRPTRWTAFDKDMAMDARVDSVLGWLAEPAATRPRFATLYFEAIDVASHDHGPDSPQARDAVRDVDAALGRLVDGLAARGQLDAVDLVIVSDHGMATVPAGQVVALEDMVSPEDAEVVTGGQIVGFVPKPGREAAAERALLGAHDHYDCWRKGALPARWHYGTHPRIPPIVCQMHAGWDALPREAIARRPEHARGSHGYDPQSPSMRALFVAHGPSFRSGVRIAPFHNVDVYPLLAHLLGVPPAPNDGDAGTWQPALKPAAATPAPL
jgi:predicted AlkP superfamily pyrophosphatase or phosphodiesterase